MAHGDEIARNQRAVHIKLIDTVAATDNGAWVDTIDWENGSIDVTIAATATVQIRGSDAATKPAAASHGHQVGANITSSSLYVIERLPRWTKAMVSSWGSGNVDVTAVFRKATP